MPWALHKSFLYGVVCHFLEICEKDIAKTRHQMQVQNWIPGVQKGEKTEAWRNAVCVWRHAKRTREAEFVTSYTSTTLLDLLKVGTSTPLKLSKNYPFGIILYSSTPLMVSGGNLAQTGQTCTRMVLQRYAKYCSFSKIKRCVFCITFQALPWMSKPITLWCQLEDMFQ